MPVSEDEFKRQLSEIRDELREFNKDIGKPEVANIVNSRAIRDSSPDQWPDITQLVLVILNGLRVPRYVQPNNLSNMEDMPACQMQLYGSRALTELKAMIIDSHRTFSSDCVYRSDIDLIACAVPDVGIWWYTLGGKTELSEYCVMKRRCPYPPTEKECILKTIKAMPASPKDVGNILEAKCREAYNIGEEKYNKIDSLINEATEYTRSRIEGSQKRREAEKIRGGFLV